MCFEGDGECVRMWWLNEGQQRGGEHMIAWVCACLEEPAFDKFA